MCIKVLFCNVFLFIYITIFFIKYNVSNIYCRYDVAELNRVGGIKENKQSTKRVNKVTIQAR